MQRDGLALRLLADLEAHAADFTCSQAILSVKVRRHQNPPSRFTNGFAQKAKSRKISKENTLVRLQNAHQIYLLVRLDYGIGYGYGYGYGYARTVLGFHV
ncbi:hypothetical protein [Clostridium phoceensis]|uniref:hypothetical protein n=1 Tax=Clostridium phoceensis TaxID=1650661 RepID=UPI0023F0ADB9|nr:hypothetical protein [Clostridium phoceensis]